jgi:hypothetical protein
MSEARTLSNVLSLRQSVDSVKESVDRLEALLPEREDNAVLLDFLEDDLRESMDAISDVEAHFTDVLDSLRTAPITPQALVDLADDTRVLNRLEYLMVVASQLRKRLTQAAGRIKLAR